MGSRLLILRLNLMVTRTGDNLSITGWWCLVCIAASLTGISLYWSGCRTSTRLVRVVVVVVVVRGPVSLLVNWLGRWLRSWLLVVLASDALSLHPASFMHNHIACYAATFGVLWDSLVVVALLGELRDDVPGVDKAGNVAQRTEKNVDETIRRTYSALHPNYDK